MGFPYRNTLFGVSLPRIVAPLELALNSGLYDGFLFYVIIYSPEVLAG